MHNDTATVTVPAAANNPATAAAAPAAAFQGMLTLLLLETNWRSHW
jgi:hypothetical protein